jgi:tetratricopeptide (TPR) repeat protein/DNA-directed RNA polymerase subunit RPC12/RpoP
VTYWCNCCKKTVIPRPASLTMLLIFKDATLVCPECGSKDIVVLADEAPSPAPAGAPTRVPSAEEFFKYYQKGRLYEAIGVPANASKTEIRDAINRFQRQHIDSPVSRSKELKHVRDTLLNPKPALQIPELPQVKVIPIDPIKAQKAELLMEEIKRLEESGYNEEAIALCTQVIELDPSQTKAYQKRAWLTLMLPNYQPYLDRVIADCKRVLEEEPDDSYVTNDVGRAYVRKKDFDNARIYYRKALELNPSLTIAAINLMAVNILTGRYDEAIGVYGELQFSAIEPMYQLIGSYAVCTACALRGDDYAHYIEPLEKMEIFITARWNWNNDHLDGYIDRLENELRGSNPADPDVKTRMERLQKARNLQKMFKDHYRIPK